MFLWPSSRSTANLIERYAKVHKRSWLKDEQRLNFYAIPLWANRRLAEINRVDVSELHARISKTSKYAANRLLETLTTLFRQAIITGYVPDSHPIPTWDIKRNKEKPRKVIRELEDYLAISKAIKKLPKKLYRYALFILMYTGLRHGELIQLRW